LIRNGAGRAPVAAHCFAQGPGRKRRRGWLCARWVVQRDGRQAVQAPPHPSSRRARQSRRPPRHGRGLQIHARPRATGQMPGSPPIQEPGKAPGESLRVETLLRCNDMGTPPQEALKHPLLPSCARSSQQSGCPGRKAGSDLIKINRPRPFSVQSVHMPSSERRSKWLETFAT